MRHFGLAKLLSSGLAAVFLASSATALAQSDRVGAPPVATSSGASLIVPPIAYTMWTLENGLKVIAVEDDTTSTVTTSLWYAIGSKHDPEGQAGFSHLIEHIGSRKTENIPLNMINSLTADIGGTRNASNWVDRTNYFEQVPAAYLETMLWTHRERMAKLVIDEDVFESERNVVKEELRQRVLSPPYGRLQRFILPEIAFDVLPHRRPGIGSVSDLDAASVEDARAFFEAYYGPDTATLIVAGNFEINKLRSLVDQYFADIPPRKNPVPTAILEYEPEIEGPRTVVATAPNVPLPAIGGVWKAQPITHKDAPAIQVLMTIISGGKNSRLTNGLISRGIAVEVAGSAPMFREAGHINLYALALPEHLKAAGAALDMEVARLRRELVSSAELAEAKNEIFAAALSRRETARGRAFELGEALVASGDPGFADLALDLIQNVTAEDVRRVALHYLAPERRVTLIYKNGPEDASSYANPVPLPDFGSLPPSTNPVRIVRREGTRVLPPGPIASPAVAKRHMVEARLSNSIPVIAAQTGSVPIATISMVFPGGSKTDPKGREGIAELAASLAASGINKNGAAAIAAGFERLGAIFEGAASSDGTTFTLTAPTANLAEAGDLAARIIKGAIYPDEEFQRARAQRLETLRVTMTDPVNVSWLAAKTALYGGAPYGNHRGGTLKSLAKISRDDLLYHRQHFFHPNRMQIVISGGLSPDDAVGITEEMFGDWVSTYPVGRIVEEAAGEVLPARTIVIDMPGATQASVYAAMRAPARSSADFDALQVANAVLGGGSRGRLFEEIRTKRALSYGAYSRIEGRKDGSLVTASAQTPNETAGEVARIMLDEIARLNAYGLTEELLTRRRLFLKGSYNRAIETSSGFNAITAGLLLHGLPASEVSHLVDRLAAVDVTAANQAVRRVIDPEQVTLVIVGNAKRILSDLRSVREDIEVIDADRLDLSNPSLRASRR